MVHLKRKKFYAPCKAELNYPIPQRLSRNSDNKVTLAGQQPTVDLWTLSRDSACHYPQDNSKHNFHVNVNVVNYKLCD